MCEVASLTNQQFLNNPVQCPRIQISSHTICLEIVYAIAQIKHSVSRTILHSRSQFKPLLLFMFLINWLHIGRFLTLAQVSLICCSVSWQNSKNHLLTISHIVAKDMDRQLYESTVITYESTDRYKGTF